MLDLLQRKQGKVVDDPKFITALFSDVRFSILWLIIRVYVGWQWVDAGMHKLQDVGWTQTGESLLSFFTRIVAIPETGRPPITYDWYRNFIQYLIDTQSYVWFAKVIAYGEFLVGIALIVGAFVGVAAFFGAVMNFNFMLAGSASTNPVLFILALLLIFAWKTAGFIGADYVLLPLLGTPWGQAKVKNDEGLKEANATA